MKYLLRCALVCGFFLIVAPIFAQTEQEPAYTILISPVEAESDLKDMVHEIYTAMFSELRFQGELYSLFDLVEAHGAISSPPTRQKLDASELAMDPKYVILPVLERDGDAMVLTLYVYDLDDPSGNSIFYQEMACRNSTDAQENMAYFCWSFTSNLPPDERIPGPVIVYGEAPEDDAWKNKWIYLSPRAGGSVRYYKTEEIDAWTMGVTFDVGFRAAVQFVTFMPQASLISFSLQTGLDLTQDNAVFRGYGLLGTAINAISVDNTGLSLTIPVVLKFNFKPRRFTSGLYGGAYFLLPLDSSSYTSPLGITLGADFGVKMGPGALIFDFHWGMDLGMKEIDPPGEDYTRNMFSLTVGYEFGFINHKPLEKRTEE
jgi:hypothetical protein